MLPNMNVPSKSSSEDIPTALMGNIDTPAYHSMKGSEPTKLDCPAEIRLSFQDTQRCSNFPHWSTPGVDTLFTVSPIFPTSVRMAVYVLPVPPITTWKYGISLKAIVLKGHQSEFTIDWLHRNTDCLKQVYEDFKTSNHIWKILYIIKNTWPEKHCNFLHVYIYIYIYIYIYDIYVWMWPDGYLPCNISLEDYTHNKWYVLNVKGFSGSINC